MAADTLGSDSVDSVFWDDLLHDIRRGAVVPVIGRELLTVDRDGKLANLEDELAAQFAARYITGTDPTAGEPAGHGRTPRRADKRRTGRSALAMAAARYRAACTYADDPDLVYPAVRQLLKAAYAAPLPEPLAKLAEITDFKLFVTTTPDRWLQQALARAGRDPQLRAFALNGACPDERDLPAACSEVPMPQWPHTFVYHLLGVEGPRDFAVTEEDMLEFMHQLQEPHRAPGALLDMLDKSKLLLIGCGLPDWLTRFLVRFTRRKRLTTPGASHLVVGGTARNDIALDEFLDLFTRPWRLWRDGGSLEFVDELHARWKAGGGGRGEESPHDPVAFLHDRLAAPAAPSGTPGPEGQEAAAPSYAQGLPAASAPRRPRRGVFLSYASEDKAAVEHLKNELEAQGLVVWFDKTNLRGGDKYETVIREMIRACDAFVPVISRHVRHDLPSSRGRFFRREWKWARDREQEYRELNEGVPDEYLTNFICPISIDGTPAQDVDRWAEYHWPQREEFPRHVVEIVERREIEKMTARYRS